MTANPDTKKKIRAVILGTVVLGVVAVIALTSNRGVPTAPSMQVSYDGPPKTRQEQIARIKERIAGMQMRVRELEKISDADWEMRQQNVLKYQEEQRAKLAERITPEQREQLRENVERLTPKSAKQ